MQLKLFWKVDLKTNLIMSAQTRRKLQTQLQESINSAAVCVFSCHVPARQLRERDRRVSRNVERVSRRRPIMPLITNHHMVRFFLLFFLSCCCFKANLFVTSVHRPEMFDAKWVGLKL